MKNEKKKHPTSKTEPIACRNTVAQVTAKK